MTTARMALSGLRRNYLGTGKIASVFAALVVAVGVAYAAASWIFMVAVGVVRLDWLTMLPVLGYGTALEVTWPLFLVGGPFMAVNSK